MPSFRITVRHGRPQRYHIADVEAADLRSAVQLAVDEVPAGGEAAADLLEIRLQAAPEARSFGGAQS